MKKDVQMVDFAEIIREVETETDRKVKAIKAFGHPDGYVGFNIVFDPVPPDKREPVEAILKRHGLVVTGGGTDLEDAGPTASDVNFEFDVMKKFYKD